MKTCGVCKQETPVSYAVTLRGYADVELCGECQEEIEAQAEEQQYHVLYYTKEQEFCFDPSPHSYVVSGEKALSEIMEYVGDGRIVAILKE